MIPAHILKDFIAVDAGVTALNHNEFKCIFIKSCMAVINHFKGCKLSGCNKALFSF